MELREEVEVAKDKSAYLIAKDKSVIFLIKIVQIFLWKFSWHLVKLNVIQTMYILKNKELNSKKKVMIVLVVVFLEKFRFINSYIYSTKGKNYVKYY